MSQKITMAVSGLLLVAAATGADVLERSFPAQPGGTLLVDTDRGSVTVESGAADEVSIRVSREGSQAAIDDFPVHFEETSEGVTVRGESKKKVMFGWNHRLKVHFAITVPSRYNVQIETRGGDVTVSALEGSVETHTSGGDVELGAIQGGVFAKTSGGDITLQTSSVDAELNTSGGDIEIGQVEGQVTAHTSGGDIEIGRSGGQVKASTSGGDITVQEVGGTIDARTSGGDIQAHITQQPTANCRLSTSGGDIELRLSEGISANLDAVASGGRIHADFPVTVQGEISRSRLQGVIGAGGPQIQVRTSGGGVRLGR